MSIVAAGGPEVSVHLKSCGGEVGRLAQALGLHWRDSVLAIDPEQLAEYPSTQAGIARREARLEARREARKEKGAISEKVREKRKLKGDKVSFYRQRDTNKSERKKPSDDTRSQQVKDFLRKRRLARNLARIGDPFDDVSLEKKKQFGLSFYYKTLQVCKYLTPKKNPAYGRQ